MKPVLQKQLAFIAKSMLWSVLLYVVLMLAFNWDDVSNKVGGTNPITVMSNISLPQTPTPNATTIVPASIAHNISLFKKVAMLVRNIGGIVSITIK